MVEQDDRSVFRDACYGFLQVRRGEAGFRRRDIGDAGQSDACTVVLDQRVAVGERDHAQRDEVLHPRLVIKKVLMIAGDDVHAVRRTQIAQGLDILLPVVERAVNEIAGDDDQIDTQRI